ncbi:hypothetical protein TPHA_0A00760 [Tetrapisispora phaffii CBS 4417]|uniref:2,5-diamino-6-ribosylamino-4(3H)-pyrimidinone 5'-phosphate reductase n=1 Tax=Tetrapisispora phaffii (strain ATCC 24235 / CBS 4417 / NBRC 1672 / NRRL Y-8282 / UCD 70-5) TaxID=1071381 RepID=G8BMN3_TETPH|nr:hypothetical protein TPHA_0A00760 [Tetrapisispora phaffii CBS 4417]CCE61161.1 hypothetical protein TPHA_0A00760 [Tetrapisispora phaffii CBS 4417]
MKLSPLDEKLPNFLHDYLPIEPKDDKVFVTLTYAQSLDSKISSGPGIRTVISHPETKTMTHYLRYHHQGILIGTSTLLVDDPGLNCKWNPFNETTNLDKYSPRPIVIDMKRQWNFKGSKMEQLYLQKKGKSPIIVVNKLPTHADQEENVDYFVYDNSDVIDWELLFLNLKNKYNIKSIMVEGGGNVINQLLLRHDLVNSLIITIGSVYLGENGVSVSPSSNVQLSDVKWWVGTTDSVLSCRLKNNKDSS